MNLVNTPQPEQVYVMPDGLKVKLSGSDEEMRLQYSMGLALALKRIELAQKWALQNMKMYEMIPLVVSEKAMDVTRKYSVEKMLENGDILVFRGTVDEINQQFEAMQVLALSNKNAAMQDPSNPHINEAGILTESDLHAFGFLYEKDLKSAALGEQNKREIPLMPKIDSKTNNKEEQPKPTISANKVVLGLGLGLASKQKRIKDIMDGPKPSPLDDNKKKPFSMFG